MKGGDRDDMLLANTGLNHMKQRSNEDDQAALHSEISPWGSRPRKSGMTMF